MISGHGLVLGILNMLRFSTSEREHTSMAEGQGLLLRKDLERVVDRLHQERTHVAPYQEDYRRLLDNHG